MDKLSIGAITEVFESIDIYDIERVVRVKELFGFVPTYYDCTILLSPLVIRQLIKWMVVNQFIRIEGRLVLRTRTKKEILYESE